jgi:hypothetical protein
MGDNWLDELHQLHEQDKTSQQADIEPLDLSVLSAQRVKQATDLLRQVDAHNLLRQVQKALLNGKGVIDVFEHTKRYDRTISLAWLGPISAARKPDPKNPEAYQYILIGVRGGKIYVNDKEITPATPEALKIALLEAAKNPARS